MTDAVGGLTAVRALADIRVVDLSTGVAGPLAAMMLADFGADVVKVEPPSGDPGRSRPGFAMWNRSKRRLTIDAEATPDRLLDLLAVADVCVSGGGAGGLADHVDADAACQANPGLVYLEVPPFLGETPVAIAYQHVREQAPPPRSIQSTMAATRCCSTRRPPPPPET